MYRLIIVAFIFFFTGQLFAQEELTDLMYNPILIESNKKKLTSRVVLDNRTFFITDTIALPVIDDFSTHKFVSYNSSDYSLTAKTDSNYFSFKVDGQIVRDSFPYKTSQSYSHFYNFITLSPDSSLTTSKTVSYFDLPNRPSLLSRTEDAWPVTNRYTFNNNGDIVDTIKGIPDKIARLEMDTVSHFIRVNELNAIWKEERVYRNSHFSVNQPTIGVATFDGIDSTGYPYNFTNPSAYGVADNLTSKPIDLNYLPSDSIYLSFYYQPQGVSSNFPESEDSLILEFFSPVTSSWTRVWFQRGYQLGSDSAFKQVMVPIKNTNYLKSGFQFRFKNRATLSGSLDQWHLDYVYLSNNRFRHDTLPNDAAYIFPKRSLINTYESVPWKHYLPNPGIRTKADFTMTFRNLNVAKNLFYTFRIVEDPDDLNNTLFFFQDNKNINANSLSTTNPPITLSSFVFPDNAEPFADFYLVDSLRAGVDFIEENNQAIYRQRFANYYAYDDGSAEAGYTLNAAGGRLALKFTPWMTDTLTGVQIFFSRSNENAKGKPFKLTIWSEGVNEPGTILYQKATYDTVYYDKGEMNLFHQYKIDNLIISENQPFYIGFVQPTSERINIGLDRNRKANSNMFYNTTGIWYNSQFAGSWMIRPVFGSRAPIGINDQVKNSLDLDIYPNPANEFVYIKNNGSRLISVELFDIYGKLIQSYKNFQQDVLDVSQLSSGLYLIRLENEEGSATKKLIINK